MKYILLILLLCSCNSIYINGNKAKIKKTCIKSHIISVAERRTSYYDLIVICDSFKYDTIIKNKQYLNKKI